MSPLPRRGQDVKVLLQNSVQQGEIALFSTGFCRVIIYYLQKNHPKYAYLKDPIFRVVYILMWLDWQFIPLHLPGRQRKLSK